MRSGLQNLAPFRRPDFVSGGGGGSLLLDLYTNATFAFSFRLLRTAYAGDLVTVRRSGDDAESGFNATEISDGTLASWVTAGGGTEDGFIKTWHDQSGNGNDVSQVTAGDQPLLVDAGVVRTLNGKPSIFFNNGPHLLAEISYTVTAQSSACVFNYIAGSSNDRIFSQSAGSDNDFSTSGHYIPMLRSGTSSSFGSYANSGFRSLVSGTVSTQQLLESYHSGSAVVNYMDATAGSSYSDTLNKFFDIQSLGTQPNSVNSGEFRGDMQELVVWNSDKSGSRSGIEGNINTHYSIY
jgi:hypothetical protein